MKSLAMRWLLGVLAAIVLLTLPMLLENQFYLHHVTIIFLFSVVALGYWLIYRTGQVSFAQAGFMMIGAYTTACLTKYLDFSFWLTLPLAGVVTALVALAIGIPTLRLRGAYFFLITFAFGEIIRLFFNNAWEPGFGGTQGIHKIPDPSTIEIPYLFTLVFDKTYAGNSSFYYLVLVFFIVTKGVAIDLFSSHIETPILLDPISKPINLAFRDDFFLKFSIVIILYIYYLSVSLQSI